MGSKEGIVFLLESCYLIYEQGSQCWEQNQGPLEEKQLFLATELSLSWPNLILLILWLSAKISLPDKKDPKSVKLLL